jgi:hypothetical protein
VNDEEEFPAIGPSYELRFTFRALEDLRCKGFVPSDLEGVRKATPWGAIVEDFIKQRTLSPGTTGGTLSKVGHPDICELHGLGGERAATWFDADSGVCWFLGLSPDHTYKHFEDRAAVGELLPTLRDETLLELERQERDFDHRVERDLRLLVASALERPGIPTRATVGELLQLEVTALVIDLGGARLVDLALIVHLPAPVADDERPSDWRPPAWPGGKLVERLAGIATGLGEALSGHLAYPEQVETAEGHRAIDRSRELCIVVTNWEP